MKVGVAVKNSSPSPICPLPSREREKNKRGKERQPLKGEGKTQKAKPDPINTSVFEFSCKGEYNFFKEGEWKR